MKRQKSKQLIYSMVLFLFIFNLINREFLFLGIIDLRLINLSMIFLSIFFDRKVIIEKLRDLTDFQKKATLFYIIIFLTSIGVLMMRKPYINYSLFLRLNFLYMYGFVSFLYLSILKEYFDKKVFIRTVVFSILILIFSMVYAYFNRNLVGIWSSVKGVITNNRTKNFLGGFSRLSGYAEDPNYASFSLIVSAALIYFLTEKRSKYIFIGICVLAYMFTASKTVFLGTIFALTMYFMIEQMAKGDREILVLKSKYILVLLILCSSIVIGLILYLVSIDFKPIVGSSLGLRFEMWESAFKLGMQNPILGSGLGSARYFFESNGGWVVQTHNTILQIFSENGVIALVVFISLMLDVSNTKNRLISFISLVFIVFSLSYELNYLSFFPFILYLYVLGSAELEDLGISSIAEFDFFFVNKLKGGGAEQVVKNLLQVEGDCRKVVVVQSRVEDECIEDPNVYVYMSLTSPFRFINGLITVNSIVSYFGIDSIRVSTAHLLKSHLAARVTKLGRTTVYVFHSTSSSFNLTNIHKFIYKFIYNKNRIAVLSDEIGVDLKSKLAINPKDCYVFSNAVPKRRIYQRVEQTDRVLGGRKFILFAGRLEPVKRPDFFVSMFYETKLYESYDAYILGEGTMLKELHKQVDELEMSERVKFLGFVHEPYDYFNKASLTVMCSEFEASPMTILEALYSRGRVVSYDCDFGPRQILKGSLSDFLVKSRNMSEWGPVIKNALENYPPYDEYSTLFVNRDITDSYNRFVEIFNVSEVKK